LSNNLNSKSTKMLRPGSAIKRKTKAPSVQAAAAKVRTNLDMLVSL